MSAIWGIDTRFVRPQDLAYRFAEATTVPPALWLAFKPHTIAGKGLTVNYFLFV